MTSIKGRYFRRIMDERGALLSAIVGLLPQINVRKNMRTALFCVVCALPVFIMLNKETTQTDM